MNSHDESRGRGLLTFLRRTDLQNGGFHPPAVIRNRRLFCGVTRAVTHHLTRDLFLRCELTLMANMTDIGGRCSLMFRAMPT